jgi:hypothetical protein
VCAYISENIVCKRLDDIEPIDIDLVWIELCLQNKKVILGVGYRPPHQNREEVEQFMDQFHTSLNSAIARSPESIIVVGDFNDRCITWDASHALSDLGYDLYDLVNVSDMVQLVSEPTHFTPHPGGITESCIDIIITDSPGYVKKVDILPPLGSKHATVFMEFQITYPRDKSYMRQVWDYSKGQYNNLNVAINNYPWDTILNDEQHIDEKASKWTNTYLSLCAEHIPNREIRVRPRDLPWITKDCKRLIRIRDRLYKKFRRTKSLPDESNWKTKAREVRLALNTARLHYNLKLKETLSDPKLAPKKYWSLVKKIYGSKKGMSIPVLEDGDRQLSTSLDKATAFTDYFKQQKTLQEPANHMIPLLPMLTEQRLGEITTSSDEIGTILNSLEVGKAHGSDGVSVRLLKETADSTKKNLCDLINASFKAGKVPCSWKRANVSPVYKKGPRSTVGNYRPISLLSILSKVQERVVFKRLYTFLASNNLLTSKNSGFKEKDSAICQLINIVDKIYRALEDGKYINMSFLTLRKPLIRYGTRASYIN